MSSSPLNGAQFATRAVHAGERLNTDKAQGWTPVVTPIQPSVGFLYESSDEVDAVFADPQAGYVYPRYGSPTVAAFEAAMANLEGGEAAHAFASGMAALHVSLLAAGVRAGSRVVAAPDLYGATFTLLRSLLASLNVTPIWVDAADLAAVEAAIKEHRPVALLVEILSNPLIKAADVPTLAKLAHQYDTKLIVDNTFASPYLFTPLAHGADFAVHSATKYLAGHGDVLAGVVVTSAANRQGLFELNKYVGSTLSPFEAWLALRGLKTLPLRMHQQCANAQSLAERLQQHPRIARVNYPGLPGHPQHALVQQLFGGKGYGGMLSFEIAHADQAAAFRFMERLRLCLSATTLGDIYSLVLHPATTSHRSLSTAERQRIGIPDGLVRLSAGIESVEDIWTDLDQALD